MCYGMLAFQSTYCATLVQHAEAINRSVQVVNLDPAAEHFSYPVMAGEIEMIISTAALCWTC